LQNQTTAPLDSVIPTELLPLRPVLGDAPALWEPEGQIHYLLGDPFTIINRAKKYQVAVER
jgi:hypothetical protein